MVFSSKIACKTGSSVEITLKMLSSSKITYKKGSSPEITLKMVSSLKSTYETGSRVENHRLKIMLGLRVKVCNNVSSSWSRDAHVR